MKKCQNINHATSFTFLNAGKGLEKNLVHSKTYSNDEIQAFLPFLCFDTYQLSISLLLELLNMGEKKLTRTERGSLTMGSQITGGSNSQKEQVLPQSTRHFLCKQITVCV